MKLKKVNHVKKSHQNGRILEKKIPRNTHTKCELWRVYQGSSYNHDYSEREAAVFSSNQDSRSEGKLSKKALIKAPARKEAIRKLTEKMQEELKPFMQFCNHSVESFSCSNPAYRTFTTPREQFRSVLEFPHPAMKNLSNFDKVELFILEATRNHLYSEEIPGILQNILHFGRTSFTVSL